MAPVTSALRFGNYFPASTALIFFCNSALIVSAERLP
jgi:hypothetical protein